MATKRIVPGLCLFLLASLRLAEGIDLNNQTVPSSPSALSTTLLPHTEAQSVAPQGVGDDTAHFSEGSMNHSVVLLPTASSQNASSSTAQPNTGTSGSAPVTGITTPTWVTELHNVSGESRIRPSGIVMTAATDGNKVGSSTGKDATATLEPVTVTTKAAHSTEKGKQSDFHTTVQTADTTLEPTSSAVAPAFTVTVSTKKEDDAKAGSTSMVSTVSAVIPATTSTAAPASTPAPRGVATTSRPSTFVTTTTVATTTTTVATTTAATITTATARRSPEQPASTRQEHASVLDIGDDDGRAISGSSNPGSPKTDPLVVAVISVFIITVGILALVGFLKYRRRNNQTEFRRLQDVPMDDMMEDTPLSLYSY
ncbi:mucin-5AC isoform X1 [Latimeria chalumnae]|uniref:mucin-5AC isoform X1 n=1 Tax=Latimeria chalumnae TaxID=7897 RepID=UPI00313D772C